MMKKVIYFFVVMMIVTGLVLGFTGPSAAKPIKFKAVAFLPVSNTDVGGFRIFVDMVNKKFKDYVNQL